MKPLLAGGFPRLWIWRLLQCSEIPDPSETFWPPLLWGGDVQKLPTEAARAGLGEEQRALGTGPADGPICTSEQGAVVSCWLTSQNRLTCASRAEQASQPAPLSGPVSWTARGASCSDYFLSSTGQPPKAPSLLLRLQDRNLNECLRKSGWGARQRFRVGMRHLPSWKPAARRRVIQKLQQNSGAFFLSLSGRSMPSNHCSSAELPPLSPCYV